MPPNIPQWLLGKHISSVVANVQTVAASDGALADAITGPEIASLITSSGAWPNISIVTGIVDELQATGGYTTENISAITSTKAHHVPIARRDQITVTEIMRTGTTTQGTPGVAVGNCFLANLWSSAVSRVVRFSFARAGNRFDFYGLMTSYNEALRRGKTVARMTIEMVDPNQQNMSLPVVADR